MRAIHNKRMISAAVASAILLGVLGGCNKQASPESLIAEAKQFQSKGDTKAAVIQLKNAISQKPDDAEARLLLGMIYNDAGDGPSAEKELRKAMSLGAPAEKTLIPLGRALLSQQQYQKVLDETKDPAAQGTAEVLAMRGTAHLFLRQNDLAKTAFTAALGKTPDFPAALIGQARLAVLENDEAGADALTAQAVAKNPQSPDVWMFQGDMLRAKGKMEEALAAYDKVLTITPAHRSANIEKAYINIGLGKFDAAKADLVAARKNTPGNLLATHAEALLNYTQNNNAVALDLLQKVLKAAPDYMPAVLLTGAVQFKLGSMPQAEQHLKKYLLAFPNNVYARKLMASTLLKTGQTTEALAVLEPAMAGAATDPQLLALAGEASLQARDYPKATDYFQKAAVLAPKAASLRTSLALAKLAQGDDERAITELEASTKLDDKSPQAGTLLVLTELRLKRYDKALAAAKALEATQPNDPSVHNLKGGVYLGMNDLVQARQAFEKAVALQPTFFPAVSNLAQLALRDKQPDLARKAYTDLLAKDKKNIDAMNALAAQSWVEGKPAETLSWLEKANTDNPEALAPVLRLAAHYMRINQADKALTLLRKYQPTNPTNGDLLDLLGQAQLATKDYDGGLETYGKLAGLMPKAPKAHLRLAGAHMLLKNENAAAEDLRRALTLAPDFLDAQVASFELALRTNKPEQAQAITRDIQKQRPKEAIGYLLEGDFHLAKAKPALALPAYEKAYALRPTPVLMVKLGTAMKGVGKGKEASARLNQWLASNPKDITVLLYLAEEAIASGAFKDARVRLESISALDPANVPALNNLAWVYQREKDSRALATAEKAYKLASTSPAVMDTLGWILVEQGDLKRGVPLLEQAVKAAPGADDLRYHWAAGLAKLGDKANARKELEKALSSGKTFASVEDAKALMKQL